jgi:hypothetical protein
MLGLPITALGAALLGPRHSGADTLLDDRALELGEDAELFD